MSDKFYCPLPFIHQFVCADGIAMCCIPPNRHDVTIEEFENSDYLKNVKSQLKMGEIPSDCQLCYREESAGRTSMRIQSLKDFGYSDGPSLQYLDLRYDNLCNLACRMCNSGYSSLWSKEVDKFPELQKFQKPFKRNNVSFKILEDFNNVTKNLKKLSLTGGEPLLIKDHLIILEKLLEQNKTDVELTITTNLTTLNPNWFNIIKQFQQVHWTVSMDEVGNYIRWPYDWNQVDSNLQKILTLSNSVAINCTLTAYSLLNLDTLVEYFVNLKTKAIGPFELWFSVATFPKMISIDAVPIEFVPLILKKLTKAIELLKHIPEHQTSLQTLISIQDKLKNQKSNPELFNKFWEYTQMLDEQRNQNFYKTFEEYQKLN